MNTSNVSLASSSSNKSSSSSSSSSGSNNTKGDTKAEAISIAHENAQNDVDDQATSDADMPGFENSSDDDQIEVNPDRAPSAADLNILNDVITESGDVYSELPAIGAKHALMDDHERARRASFIGTLPVVDAHPTSDIDHAEDLGVVATVGAIPVNISSPGDDSPTATTAPAAHEEVRQRAFLISVHVYKKTSNDKLGIFFEKRHRSLKIKSFSSTGMLKLSSLQPGDKVVSINGVCCASLSAYQASALIRGLAGLITIVVEAPFGNPEWNEICAFKTRHDERLGLVLESDSGYLRIQKVNPSRLLGGNPIMRARDFILSINGLQCVGVDAQTARAMIAASFPTVTIVVSKTYASQIEPHHVELPGLSNSFRDIPQACSARVVGQLFDPELGLRWQGREPMYVSVAIHKPIEDVLLGISFNEIDGHIEIDRIRSDKLLGSSPLRSGMRIMSINEESCVDWSIEQTVSSLKAIVGEVRIVAFHKLGDANYVQAMATKPTPTSKIGIVLMLRGDSLRLRQIKPISPFAHSVLNKGDHLLAVNGIPMSRSSMDEAITLIATSEHHVTILAKTESFTGVVVSHEQELVFRAPANPRGRGEYRDRNDIACKLCLLSILAGVVFLILTVNVIRVVE